MSKRILFLLGAGAAHNWFDKSKGISASTDDITNEIICNSFCNELNNRLKFKSTFVNFETIINEVEDLFLYYYALLPPMDENFTRNYEKEEWISKFFNSEDAYLIKDNLYAIFKSCISIIISKIRKYDACIKSNWNQATNDLEAFLLFLNEAGHKNVLRGYTLNYDQMFSDASAKTKLNIFDGFEKRGSFSDQVSLSSDLKHYSTEKILKDSETNCFYNLHGSIFWHWSEEIQKYVKRDFIFEQNEFQHIITNLKKSSKGERILKVPIITGFKKIERLEFEPFSAMYDAFKKDCLSADVFIIIGYSFNDPHINNVLASAQITNKKVLIVDYNLNKDNTNLQSIIGNDFNDVINKGVNSKGNIRLCNEGISDFLKVEYYRTLINFF